MIAPKTIQSSYVGDVRTGLSDGSGNHTSTMKVLIVEDEPDLTHLLTYRLTKEGYEVYSAAEGWAALKVAEETSPDLILLDIGIPGLDGLEVCKWLRRHPRLRHCAIYMLTARGSEHDQITGFEAGADDYLVKPVSPNLLISRLAALKRRLSEAESDKSTTDQLRIGNLLVDKKRFVVMRVTGDQTEIVHFPRKEFKLLHFMASQPGIVLTRDQLLDEVWEHDATVNSRTVDVHINKIRKKIGDEWIETVTGVGYRFKE